MSTDRAVLNTVRDAIFLADFDTGLIVDANVAAEALCGRDLAELRTLHCSQLHAFDQTGTPSQIFDEASTPVLTEGLILHKDGHRIPVEIASSCYTSLDGRRMRVGVFRDITERDAARKALRESEERFRQVAESAGEFIWEVDADGLYIYASPVVERLLGYTPEEVVGRMHFYDFFVPENRAQTRAAAFQVFARQEPFGAFLNWNVRKDGKVVALETTGVPVRDANGKFLGYRGADTDVTERKQAEAALRQSEKIYRAIGESIDYGLWICAPDGRNTYASESFLKLVGLTQEQCSSFGWGDVLHPEDAERTIAAWKQCVRTEGRWDVEHRFRGVDGEWHPILARGVPVRDEEGRVTCWAGINLDISELKRTQERLRDSERHAQARASELQAIMDAAPAAILIAHDPECRRISGNRTAHALLRQQPGQNLSKSAPEGELPPNFRVVRDGVELPPWELPIQKAVSSGQPVRNCEVEILFADGATTHLMGNVEPSLDDNGRPQGAVAVLSDITERKNQELELKKFVSLADNSVEFIGICDMNFMPFYANQAALRLVGLDSVEQASRIPVPQFFFPEDQPFMTGEFFPRAIRDGRAEVEIRFRHFKTGKPVWMIYNVFYIKDSSGRPVGLATVSRDITERKRAEAALRESEDRLKNAERLAHLGNWQWDLQTNNVSWSDETFRIFGKPPDYIPSYEGFLRSLTLEDGERVVRWLNDCVAERRGNHIEFQIAWPNGEVRTVACISEVLLDEGGVPVRMFGACQDISEYKQIEDLLRSSEQQLRALAGSLLTAQEDERRRLSRELHDDVTQRLAFLSIELGKLLADIPDSYAETQVRVRALQEQTLHLSSEVRRLSHGLHPSAIEDFGLSIALEEFCHQFGLAKEVKVEFEGFIEASELDTAGATCLYRVAQESLRNAVVHGGATEIRVELIADDGSIHLQIRDNGKGFSIEEVRTKPGLGLIGMRERIRSVHGKLTISSQPGQGTEITAVVPLSSVSHEAIANSIG